MTKLVEAIAKSLVDNPDGVEVTETEGVRERSSSLKSTRAIWEKL